MRKYGKRFLCFLLALAMVCSTVPSSITSYAAENSIAVPVPESEPSGEQADTPSGEPEEPSGEVPEEPSGENDGESSGESSGENDGEEESGTEDNETAAGDGSEENPDAETGEEEGDTEQPGEPEGSEDASDETQGEGTGNEDAEEAEKPEDAESPEDALEEGTDELPDDSLELLPEEGLEEQKEELPYENYVYGDPAYSGNYVIGTDADGNDIYEMYAEDPGEIIAMAEEGMDLERFFAGTIFSGFTLDDLYAMVEEGLSFDYIANTYLIGSELPDWVVDALGRASTSIDEQISLYADGEGPSSLTSMGCQNVTAGEIGVLPSLGSDLSHGTVKRLLAKGDDGITYSAFCAKYGGSYRSGWQYHPVDYSACVAPNGSTLSENQYNLIRSVINTYLKTTNQTSADYAATQTVIWYIINHDSSSFWAQDAWTNGGLSQVAPVIWPADPSYIYGALIAYAFAWDSIRDGSYTWENYGGGIDHYPGQAATIQFWAADNDNAQWIITWDIGSGDTTVNQLFIPYVDNFYMEKEAVTKYNVEVTKESVITNELLEGIQFQVVESEADGFDLTYDIYKGTLSEYGVDYPNATVETFGQAITETDPVPYMDDDVEPSGGQHKTVITTDENGYASTAFVHQHTFREFYSKCYNGNMVEIDHEQYLAAWEYVLQEMGKAADGEPLSVLYMGQVVEMTADQIQEIYDLQQIVYTQSQEAAQNTIEYLYDNYVARTYTYTVTELDTYTREASTDSNDKSLAEITLPKEGYRKDVTDVTTMKPYEEVVENGGTMSAGGLNDADENTDDLNVTNEPWYNQIFINKTDLETNSQILYDTEFEIYEYYQWKATIEGQEQKIYPAMLLNQMLTENGTALRPEHIAAASISITDEDEVHEYLNQELDVAELVANINNPKASYVGYTPTSAGTYKVHLNLTLDSSADVTQAATAVYEQAELHEIGSCTCADECLPDCPVCALNVEYCQVKTGQIYTASALYAQAEHRIDLMGSSADVDAGTVTYTTADGGTIVSSQTDGGQSYVYTATDGTQKTYGKGAPAYASIYSDTDELYFTYYEIEDTGIVLYSADGTNYSGEGNNCTVVSAVMDAESGSMTLSFYYGRILPDGTYQITSDFSVSENELTISKRDENVGTDINDYTTWGQDNYEIVRVTADIAKQMGWSDSTIGMYTVHRINATDQYTGTTFSSTDDKTTGEEFGYYEYGTLYYTQANLGHFAIVEKTAPADGDNNGYLGNYEDRDYTKLSDESTQKNFEGAPYDTEDQLSTVKMVHYLHLCADTNQYATYMLTDGFKAYDSVYYTNYVETLDDPGQTPTEDGYDAHYYQQSGLNPTVGMERFTLDDPVEDVLNVFWDRMMNQYLQEKSGILVNRDSEKTDTYYSLEEETDLITNFVGTTINNDSFNDNNSAESEITYNGTYTDTQINYNSYAGEQAEFLNNRHGFNGTEYLQVGEITYDDGEAEKYNRFNHTEDDVNKEQGYSFIDERTYGFIRFTKYDAEAGRYVDGDLDAGYEGGTDHGDADLDGAIYSLYVSESNSFDVDYLEGTLDGVMFWAQPLSTGGYRVIWDADNDVANGFTDEGTNAFEDYPHAYVSGGKLYLDYTNEAGASAEYAAHTKTYHGIQHPDGMYGGAKHNGWFAVLEEQQVFIDADKDGYGDTWTVQDVTLENGAKVASATIENGEFQIDGLYLGDYYLAEEIRDSIVIYSNNNDEEETSEIKWLSFAPGYLAATDDDGNPVKYHYSFTYEGQKRDDTDYDAEQVYVQKETSEYSEQEVIKGAGFQLNKESTGDESSGSGNTEGEALEGAGFTVYLISELSLIKDGTIQPAWSIDEGNMLVKNNDLVALFDEADNFVGYQYTEDYIIENEPFTEKYGTDYDLEEVNRLIYVADHGYYYIQDILDAYHDRYYSNETQKWDFTNEEQAIARMYEDDAEAVESINAQYDYQDNHLNNGSPCEWYGPNGISEGWQPTGESIANKNEYKLAELFTNHYGNIRSPELPWGAYIIVETTTPVDLFTVDPIFVTVSDSSATANRAKYVSATDASFVASLVLAKRDAQSGQDVVQSGTSYRIWDYQNNEYVSRYLLGENGELSMIAQKVFTTDESGRLNAVASLEAGKYRIEELTGPEGFYNLYWDQGNPTDGEVLGGSGVDADRATEDNMFLPYYGTVDFEVTTDRKYKASGITSSGNLDYIYIGESYFNDEAVGKVTILKTGEVLVGYENTDNIEYADEYVGLGEDGYNALKASAKDREVFESMKDYYDLGTDEVEYRTIAEKLDSVEITPVSHIAVDPNGVRLAAIYTDADGQLVTMNGGSVYQEAVGMIVDGETTYYPEAVLTAHENQYIYIAEDGTELILTKQTSAAGDQYVDEDGTVITDETILAALEPYVSMETGDGEVFDGPASMFEDISKEDGMLFIEYDLSMDIYEQAELRAAENTYIYRVSGQNIMNTAYLVTEDAEGNLTTNDYGTLTDDGNGNYTLTYTEAIYDPDINYNYTLDLGDGTRLSVKLVTHGVYMTAEDGDVIRLLPSGGYSVTTPDGKVTEYPDAVLTLEEENTGETFDFVYEERPLADATFQIRAAEDIESQDGNGGYWFRKGDVVATVTTGEDGEITYYAPNYATPEDSGSGSYDYTYYYGNTDGTYTSLTGQKYYEADEYATSGGIENYWVDSRMSHLDKDIYGVPAYTDETIYPNTYYNEQNRLITRRIYRSSSTQDLIATDYVTRLENEGNITTSSAGVVTQTNNGYRLTYTSVDEYAGATLKENGDYYLLDLGNGNDIEVEISDTLYRVTESSTTPWTAGDIVEKTAEGYPITHTNACEAGADNGSTTQGAADLGYTYVAVYPSASITENGDGSWTLQDADGNTIVAMEDGLYMTEAGGFLEKTANGYAVTNIKYEDMISNDYVQADLQVKGATLTIKADTMNLIWNELDQTFVAPNGTVVTLADDYSTVTVTTGGDAETYSAFDLTIEYNLHYAQKEDIVTVENTGELGTVSIYLPLGKYEIQEIATPYGFLINDQVQTVELSYVDQIKEVVFNTDADSTQWTEDTMKIWESKGLQWFLGGVNTIGEKLMDIFGVNHWIWGTYGDAEEPYYADKNGFLSFYDLRVRAWSQEETPDEETEEGGEVYVSKKDITTYEELPGAELVVTDADGNEIDRWTSTTEPHRIKNLPDGEYTLTEITAPDGYEVAESITFEMKDGESVTGTVVMYDASSDKGVIISKKDIATKEELPGAQLVVTDTEGNVMDSWTSTDKPHEIENLPDGEYTLTEITAPDGYEKAESITFEVKDGVVVGGYVVMYDAPEGTNAYISKQDIVTKEELPGAELTVTDENGHIIDRWVSTDEVHVIENLPDGKYTLTEVTAPDGYEKAESIPFTVANGSVIGGTVIMYDRPADNPDGPEDDRHPAPEEHQWKMGVGIYKADKNTNESLAGAKFGLYTKNDIFNVDGKLIVKAGTKLAVATTDENGFANFAVDIALMSKYLDPDASDKDLIYEQTVSYPYESLEAGPEEGTYWLHAEACDTILLTKEGDVYKTEDGLEVTIDEAAKTVTYLVEQSIDGNTAINTGDYYIQEITPPDGYLYDDTIYPVSFQYDDEYTMYIPVYAKHANEPTEVTLTKTDLTGTEEIPGATISVYKVKDVNDVDEDGKISHEDENLYLIDTWESTEEEHMVTGLLLSNDEWPRLNNQEVRENVYVFREEIPAPGYVTAKDIEFRIYQISDEDGNWMDADGNLYGYEVKVNHVAADQDYLSGLIVAPNKNASDWILTGQTENNWDYTEVLDGETVAKRLLVNENLVIFLNDGVTQETVDLVLREKDFAGMDFDTVYIENKQDLVLERFFPDKQVDERPEDSRITYTQVWGTLDDMDVYMYDDTTKIAVTKQDIVTGEDVIGAELTIKDKETGEVIDSWITGEDGMDEDGKAIPHRIEGQLIVGRTYILEEVLAPTEDGYVKSNSIEFVVEDTGEIQHIIMEDDFTKLEISKADIVTGEEVEGATLEIWTTDENGNKAELVETWTTGDDGYDESGKPIRHVIDYLAPGDYILSERLAPLEAGYVSAADVPFTLTETGILQHVEMVDDITKVDVNKVDTETGEFVGGCVLEIYSLGADFNPDEIDGEITVSEEDLVRTVTSSADGPVRVERLPIGWYVLREKSAASPYLLNENPVIFQVIDTPVVQYVTLENTKDKTTKLEIRKVDSSNKGQIAGATLELYYLPGYVAGTEVTKSQLLEENLKARFETTEEGYLIRDLTPGWYALRETAAPDGYELSDEILVFELADTPYTQTITFENTKTPPPSENPDDEEETPPPTPEIGKLTLSINGGWMWNNIRTEDSGEPGSSIKLTITQDETGLTGGSAVVILVCGVALLGCAVAGVCVIRKRRKHEEES